MKCLILRDLIGYVIVISKWLVLVSKLMGFRQRLNLGVP